jgi:hypothetical protein
MIDIKIRNNTYLLTAQILGITADNASNNDKMIEHLATLIETFPGAANQTRCFAHVLNLVAKSVLRQFEVPKANGKNVLCEAARELAAVSDELGDADEVFENGNDDGDDVVDDVGDDVVDADDGVVDDDDDGLPDERKRMSKEELMDLDKSVKPIRLVLTKVRFKLLFIYCIVHRLLTF